MKTWYTIGVLVLIALALWYVFGASKTAEVDTSTIGQTQETPALSSGNTTADIASDLDQTPDTAAALDADAAAAAAAVQEL